MVTSGMMKYKLDRMITIFQGESSVIRSRARTAPRAKTSTARQCALAQGDTQDSHVTVLYMIYLLYTSTTCM